MQQGLTIKEMSVKIFQSMHPIKDATSLPSVKFMRLMIFQSMHPIKDATGSGPLPGSSTKDFNPCTL